MLVDNVFYFTERMIYMKSTAIMEVFDSKTGEFLASKKFPMDGRTTALSYGKFLADALQPFLESQRLVKADIRIEENDGGMRHHAFSSFNRGSGMVVHEDADPLALSHFFTKQGNAPFVWLELIDPMVGQHGSNKWYSLRDDPDDEGTIDANYGRHGDLNSRFSQHAVKPFKYPKYMYYLKLYEKLAKGYEDHTKDRVEKKQESTPSSENFGSIKDFSVRELVKKLTDFANATIEANYSVKIAQINLLAVRKARCLLDKMAKISDEKEFDKKLLEVYHLIPRRMEVVRDHFVSTSNLSMGDVLRDENDLLDTLENQLSTNKKADKAGKSNEEDILTKFHLEIYPATPSQIGKVKSKLPPELQDKIVNVYRVINHDTQKRFDEYLKEHHYPSVKEFWHGSRNSNWWHIVCQGLLLHSGAPTSGNMFGHGLYFAPSPKKSWGYTSANGSYWAKGNSNTAFLGLYATAHGNPLDIYTHSCDYYEYDAKEFESKHPGHDCLFCHAGSMLRNDEVVLYREEQATINFLVEFKACS